MRAGRLISTITVERRTESLDAAGTPSDTWAPVLTTRAEIVSDNAQAFLRDYGEATDSAAVFRIRFRDGIAPGDRVTVDDRLSIAERTFEVVELAEVVRRRVLELRCKRGKL